MVILLGLATVSAVLLGYWTFRAGPLALLLISLGASAVGGLAAYLKLKNSWIRALGLFLFGLSLFTFIYFVLFPRQF